MARPKHINYLHIEYSLLKAPGLNNKEKLVLANIVGIVQGGGIYKFDNQFIADYLDCHPNHASRIVSSLKNKGWISVDLIKNKGNNSIAYRVLTLTPMGINHFVDRGINQTVKHNTKEPLVNTPDINNNINNTNNKVLSSFEKFWELYDYKVGKDKAFKSWKKLKSEEYPNILSAVKVYVENTFKEADKYPSRKHPATWLNNKGWEDEITPVVSDNSDLDDKFRRALNGIR